MKTIFISSFHPLISRNIFATPVLEYLLKAGDIRIVILCPQRSKAYLEKEYGKERIIIEGIDVTVSKRDILMRHAALSALKTHSISIKRIADMGRRGEYPALLLGSRFGHMFVRCVSRLLTPRHIFATLFAKYSPTVVFATDIQSDFDVRLMHEAKRQGISLIGMVRSWDNLTIKGLLRVIPDILMVQNLLTRDDAVRFHDVAPSIVKIVGIPHYDAYREKKSCERAYLVPNAATLKKRIVLYIATGDRYVHKNTLDCEVLDILTSSIDSDESIIVRLPIADTVNCLSERDILPDVFFEQVNKQRFERRKFVELSKEDDAHLQDLLCCADIIVTGPSTICVDAALFDKPIILIGFDGKQKRPYYNSIARYYDYDHFKQILTSEGVWYVKSERELREAMITYRRNAVLHTGGRKKIVAGQTGGLLGKASRKLADEILSFLHTT